MTRAGSKVDVRIRNIAVGGAGVGEVVEQYDGYRDLLGIAGFVPYSAPGETVEARVEVFKGRYLNATLTGVREPSPDRVEPRCSLFGSCGGCELQHMSYESQLRAKFAMIQGAFRQAKLSAADIEKLHPVHPGEDYSYRRRVTLHVDAEGKIGLYRGSSRSVIPLDTCPVSVQPINEVLPKIASFGSAVRGKISTVILDADDHGVVATLKAPYTLGSGEIRSLLEIAKKTFSDVSLHGPEGELGGFGRQILDLSLMTAPKVSIRVPAGHFSQVNAPMNRALIRKVVETAALTSKHVVFDLYAGAGNFSVPLAMAGAQVYAVECDKRLVTFCRENAARYGVERLLQVRDSSVERFLESPPKVNRLDCVLADPPRSGLGPLAESLPKSELLLLISCHLPSAARDLHQLGRAGWTIEGIYPFDMFAQTSYVEILTVLRRSAP